MRTLQEIRAAIDAADDDLVAALDRRIRLAREALAFKRERGVAAKDEAREREIMARALAACEPGARDIVCGVYERLFGGVRGTIETIARGVCVVGGKVLLCRPKGGAYAYLPGGHVEFGETAAEALVREVREETGLVATAGDFLGAIESTFLQHGTRHCEVSLVRRFTLAGVSADAEPPAVVACEPWIEFVWWPVDDLAAANLLPAEAADCVRNA